MIRVSQKIRVVLLPVFCFVALSAMAQKYRAAVQKIDSPGFYKISLQPALVAKSEAGLFDLRLLDAKGKEIPYFNSSDVPVNKEQKFVVFPKVETGIKKDTGTNIVVENKATEPIGRLWIKVKNTDVIRTMNITGSDDLNYWFAITENLPLDEPALNTNGEFVLSITFPPSNYHYLKILVNDKNKAPVKFLEAGVYVSPSLENTYQPILPVKITQRDSAKTSFITINLNDKYQVNKIHLNITGPKYFNRAVSIYDAGGKTTELISEAELNSTKSGDLFLSVKTKRLLLEIHNADNLPLTIAGAQVYQTDEYIVSYLEKGQYYLITGNANTEEPDYDLKFFKDSLRVFIPGITHLEVTKNPAYHFPVVEKKQEYTLFIWVAMIVSLVLLSLLTWRMVGEVNKNK